MLDNIIANNYISGSFVPIRRAMESYNPATGEVWARIPDSSKLEVDAAVNAATKAFPSWSSLSAAKRAQYLLRTADLLEANLDKFAEAESRDQGKPIWLAKSVDIPRAILNLRHFAHTIPHQLNTSSVLPEAGCINYTVKQAVGVAGLISPWNLPLYLLTFKLAPALMCGNTVVAKPSELTSVTAFMLCQLFDEVELPKGVVNMIFGTGQNAGAPLVTHPNVSLISFTGSTATGKSIAVATAPLFKKLSLEMGGKNAAVVFSDCDLSKCVTTLIRSSFINQGEVCLCTSRIFVQKDVYEDFLHHFIDETKALKVGCPEDPTVFLGALNSKAHLEKVKKYVNFAIEDGGTVVCGEGVDILTLPEDNKNGYFMRPTIITGLDDNARCMQEEIFGPVTCVVPFDSEEEVITRANNTNYGLCASVWTSNLGVAHRVAEKLKVGTVWTNCWLVRDLDMPFGGVKGSGMGREGTQESHEFYTEVKTVCTKIQ